jgi:hypothetical protein
MTKSSLPTISHLLHSCEGASSNQSFQPTQPDPALSIVLYCNPNSIKKSKKKYLKKKSTGSESPDFTSIENYSVDRSFETADF